MSANSGEHDHQFPVTLTGLSEIEWTAQISQGVLKELVRALEGCLYALDEEIDGFGPSSPSAISKAREVLRTVGSPFALREVHDDHEALCPSA